MTPEERRRLDAVCLRTLGAPLTSIRSFSVSPSGGERRTWQLRCGAHTLYATRRLDATTTDREATLLRRLHAAGAPVPRVVAFADGWLLQASAGQPRLSERLNDVAGAEAEALLGDAIRGLAVIHAAGQDAGLDSVVPSFAHGEATARALLATLHEVAVHTDLPLPSFDEAGFLRAVGRPGDAFIKWDARAANAACDDDGRIRFFDWQHANRRHRGDDVVWLLCDPAVPPTVDAARLLRSTAEDWGDDATRTTWMAVAHLGTRLRSCLRGPTSLDTPWEDCLAQDWLGSREAIARLGRCGAAVARLEAATEPLAAWFEALGAARSLVDSGEEPRTA